MDNDLATTELTDSDTTRASDNGSRTALRYRRGLDLIEQCGSARDIAQLVDEFFDIARDFGLSSGAGGGWTGIGRTREYRFYFNTWPADWLAFYNERQVFFEDPIIMEAQRRMAPFMWHDLAVFRGQGERSEELLAVAYEYGWADGLVVPIHGPAGYQGVVSLASMQKLDLTPADVSLFWVMSLALHARCRATPGLGESSSPPPSLSAREAQCMEWVAAGTTDWEIGQLLSISPATVHFHVERVKRRLSTSSRTHAVALLVLHGAL